jgi:sugar lactone lactonase YvrE
VDGARAVAVTSTQNELGEGVIWDDRRDELLRVDIPAGLVFRDGVADDGTLVPLRNYDVGGSVGAIVPIDGDDGWLLALDRGVSHLSSDGDVQPILEIAPADVRLNDAACDPQGRFWVGTIADRDGGAALYRLDPDGRTSVMLEDLTISNGIDWSLDGRTMYLADSGPGTVQAFDFDGERGTISNARVLIQLSAEEGFPDGLTVDAGGDLWVAIWGGGSVRRYAPDGSLLEVRRTPAMETTSCAFAGEGMHWLFVTSATENWTDAQRRAAPSAGLVFRLETDATGRPAARFRPDPDWWATVRET